MAAEQWASRTGDLRLHALCADDAAQAYAINGQRDTCLIALDTAQKALSEVGDQVPGYVWRYPKRYTFLNVASATSNSPHTIAANPGNRESLVGFGRCARDHAARSANDNRNSHRRRGAERTPHHFSSVAMIR
ncbi:MAG: hypothetical protein ACRDTG_09335 [Pseudonocardiaceae bacterium]